MNEAHVLAMSSLTNWMISKPWLNSKWFISFYLYKTWWNSFNILIWLYEFCRFISYWSQWEEKNETFISLNCASLIKDYKIITNWKQNPPMNEDFPLLFWKWYFSFNLIRIILILSTFSFCFFFFTFQMVKQCVMQFKNVAVKEDEID